MWTGSRPTWPSTRASSSSLLRATKGFNFTPLVFPGDSSIVVNQVDGRFTDPASNFRNTSSPAVELVEDLNVTAASRGLVAIRHIYREGHPVADALASRGRDAATLDLTPPEEEKAITLAHLVAPQDVHRRPRPAPPTLS